MKKYILLTGASGGIGRTIAIELANAGYRVFAGVRKQQDFDSLNSEHSNITPIFLNVLDKNSLLQAFKTIKEYENNETELYAIINNAGAVIAQPVECINLEDLKYQFQINTIAPIEVTQIFLPLLKKGKIINISSMASSGIFPYIAPYCASKRAMDILFNSLSIEMKNKDIHIVSIKPGSIKTPIWNKSIINNKKSFEKMPLHFQKKYKKDLEFLAQNANKNTYYAQNPQKVSKCVLKVLQKKTPKSSYYIGFDAIITGLIAKLPQDLLNNIINYQLKRKLKN